MHTGAPPEGRSPSYDILGIGDWLWELRPRQWLLIAMARSYSAQERRRPSEMEAQKKNLLRVVVTSVTPPRVCSTRSRTKRSWAEALTNLLHAPLDIDNSWLVGLPDKCRTGTPLVRLPR
jgi:hypothetical protein